MNRVRFLNPRTDLRFVCMVEIVIAGVASAAELERRLRETYPDAVVRERGLEADPAPIWYVYRDGVWVSDRDESETADGGIGDDLRTTADTIQGDGEPLLDVEAAKEGLPPDDARRLELSEEATRITERLATDARIETELNRESADEARPE